jgi:hypothetical protein
MSKYISKKEKLKEVIKKYIIPGVQKTDLDYYKILSELVREVGLSMEITEDTLKDFIRSGLLKEVRVITLPDEKVESWLEEQIKTEKEIKKELEERELKFINEISQKENE